MALFGQKTQKHILWHCLDRKHKNTYYGVVWTENAKTHIMALFGQKTQKHILWRCLDRKRKNTYNGVVCFGLHLQRMFPKLEVRHRYNA